MNAKEKKKKISKTKNFLFYIEVESPATGLHGGRS